MSNDGLVSEQFVEPTAGAGGFPALARDAAQAPDLLPRLLRGVRPYGPMSLREHVSVHGQAPTARPQRRRDESPLIDEIEQAGLRGCGGAGFPTAAKLRAVARARGKAIVVVNAAEGEPASRKDQTLLELLPHLVLDGAELAADAIGADEIVVGVCETAPDSRQSAAAAIDERRHNANSRVAMNLSAVPGTYVAGQESALVNYLGGGPAAPTFTPPKPFERGLKRRPTLVSNAETLAHLALVARHGAQWFRQLGTHSQPGSALVTLSGPVAHAGVYEIEHGASLASLLDAAGGTTSSPRALLLGGYGGSWIAGELLHGVALSDEHLAPHGAALGAGVVALLSDDACVVAETARVARWLADQSSGQCGPCVYGLDAIAKSVRELASGVRTGDTARRIDRLCGLVRGRGACGHPDGAARFVTSALETFAPEFADHARRGPCDACTRPSELPLPSPTRPPARSNNEADGIGSATLSAPPSGIRRRRTGGSSTRGNPTDAIPRRSSR